MSAGRPGGPGQRTARPSGRGPAPARRYGHGVLGTRASRPHSHFRGLRPRAGGTGACPGPPPRRSPAAMPVSSRVNSRTGARVCPREEGPPDHPKASSRLSHPSNRRHSRRIASRPASPAIRKPWTTLLYPGLPYSSIIFAMRLLGAVSGRSLISSGVGNCPRMVRNACKDPADAPITWNASTQENSNPSNSYCCTQGMILRGSGSSGSFSRIARQTRPSNSSTVSTSFRPRNPYKSTSEVMASKFQCSKAISEARRSTETLPPPLLARAFPIRIGVGSTSAVRRQSARTRLTNSSSVRPLHGYGEADHGRPPSRFLSQSSPGVKSSSSHAR